MFFSDFNLFSMTLNMVLTSNEYLQNKHGLPTIHVPIIENQMHIYTEQKKKRNNYILLNEQTMIQSEIIAFSSSALDIRLPNARNRFSF